MSEHPRLIEWTQPGQEREVGIKEKAKGKNQGGKCVCACRCVWVDVVGCACRCVWVDVVGCACRCVWVDVVGWMWWGGCDGVDVGVVCMDGYVRMK